jgi:hypothetical protein
MQRNTLLATRRNIPEDEILQRTSSFITTYSNIILLNKQKKHTVTFSQQMNYTDRAKAAAC